MRVGINLLWMDDGGAFQYAVDFVHELLARDRTTEYVVFVDEDRVAAKLAGEPVRVRRLDTSALRSASARWRSLRHLGALLAAAAPHLREPGHGQVRGRYDLLRTWLAAHFYSGTGVGVEFRRERLDLMIQPKHGWSVFFSGVPYVVAIHDFPSQWSAELRGVLGDRHVREADLMQRAVARAAHAVVVDSPLSRDQLHEAYGVALRRIHVLPFRPPRYIDPTVSAAQVAAVRAKYGLPPSYLFYPASLYPHKNHGTLLAALAVLRDTHQLTLPLVLTGSRGTEFASVMDRVAALKLQDQVHYLGYVPDEEMSALYKPALALVMPTLIGPTNIPVLEAFSMGCPVICSKVDGYQEQIGEAGLLVDGRSVPEVADAIRRMAAESGWRFGLIEAGRRRVAILERHFGESVVSIIRALQCEVEGPSARPSGLEVGVEN